MEVKIKKSNTKRNQADKKVWEFANREKQKQTSYTSKRCKDQDGLIATTSR